MVASRAITWAFAVTKKTLPLATAHPRLTFPQHSDTSKGTACLYRQISVPVFASSAQSHPSQPVRNMIPSTMIGAASKE